MTENEPPYLDESARELLRISRHVARNIGLEKSNILRTAGGIRWFPWVGTRCLRTLAIMCELNNSPCDTDRISLWLPMDLHAFNEFLARLAEMKYTAEQLGSRVSPRRVEKYDEFLPDELLVRACATERLAAEEANAAIDTALSN